MGISLNNIPVMDSKGYILLLVGRTQGNEWT